MRAGKLKFKRLFYLQNASDSLMQMSCNSVFFAIATLVLMRMSRNKVVLGPVF